MANPQPVPEERSRGTIDRVTKGRDLGPRPTLSEARFASPEVVDRPGIRWWWQQPVPPADLVRELNAIAEAGFGEVEIAFSPGFWADEPQREALAAVLEEAERIGVGVAATVGAAWPLQTPNTTRGTEHAAKELQYGVRYLTGVSTPIQAQGGPSSTNEVGGRACRDQATAPQSQPIPNPLDDPTNSRGATLLAVTAARVVEPGEPPTMTKVRGWEGERDAIVNSVRSTILDPASLVDLTAEVADGTVQLPDDGDWALFGFWLRDCTQGVTSFLDRNAAVAATQYLDEHQFGAANLARFEQVGTEWFEDSLEYNADSLFWTPDLLGRFEARHGYDLTRYLPVLFAHGMCRYWVPNTEPIADFEFADGSGPRIRADYYRLMTDLYIADHLLVLQEWCAAHGLAHKSQAAYGQNLEAIRSNRELVRHGGRAEGESLNSGDRAPVDRDHPLWRYALDWQRSVVAGAHQGGTTRISTELGAQFAAALAQSLGDLKQLLDKEWAAGITKPFVHGYASQPAEAAWPTQSRFFDLVSESWNDQHFPEWAHWRGLTDYWARGTVVLETGVPRTDVAISRDGFLTTAARGNDEADATAPSQLADAAALEQRGYTVQFLDPIGLVEAVAAVASTAPEDPCEDRAAAMTVPEPGSTNRLVELVETARTRWIEAEEPSGEEQAAVRAVAEEPSGEARTAAITFPEEPSGEERTRATTFPEETSGEERTRATTFPEEPSGEERTGRRHEGPPALYPDGPAYRALIVDERALAPDAAEALDQSASMGVRVLVVGEPPTADSGFAAGPAGPERVGAAMARLLARPSCVRVGALAEVPAALAGLGVLPRAAWEAAPLLTQWRDAGTRSYLLVYNTSGAPVTTELSLEGVGAVRELDLWTGGIAPRSAWAEGDRTQLRLELGGLEVRVLELDRGLAPAPITLEPLASTEVELSGWSLEVVTEEPSGARQLSLRQGPGDWREIAELCDVSGVGVYRVSVPEGVRGATLALGELAGSVTVRVGAREFGTRYVSGAVLDLGDALAEHPSIEIEVRTVLNNAAIGCDTRPVIEGLPLAQAERHPVAQGLIGPVRLSAASIEA